MLSEMVRGWRGCAYVAAYAAPPWCRTRHVEYAGMDHGSSDAALEAKVFTMHSVRVVPQTSITSRPYHRFAYGLPNRSQASQTYVMHL